jgi:glutaredoxin
MADSPPEPILYTQAGCTESAKVRRWLVDHGVPFSERDAGNDPEAAAGLAATGTFATPLLVIGEKTVLGFQLDALRTMLETHR